MYGCSNYGEHKFVPFRCKNRFCPTCDNIYSIDRTTAMSFKIIQCQHQHEDDKLMVKTIPALEFIERLIHHIPKKHFKMKISLMILTILKKAFIFSILLEAMIGISFITTHSYFNSFYDYTRFPNNPCLLQ